MLHYADINVLHYAKKLLRYAQVITLCEKCITLCGNYYVMRKLLRYAASHTCKKDNIEFSPACGNCRGSGCTNTLQMPCGDDEDDDIAYFKNVIRWILSIVIGV